MYPRTSRTRLAYHCRNERTRRRPRDTRYKSRCWPACTHVYVCACVCGRKRVLRIRVRVYSVRSSRRPRLASLICISETRTCMCYILYLYIYASSLWLPSNHLECLRGYTLTTTLIAELIHSPTRTQLDSLARFHQRAPPPPHPPARASELIKLSAIIIILYIQTILLSELFQFFRFLLLIPASLPPPSFLPIDF